MTASANANLTVIINNNGMGQAESTLSHKLIKTWLNMLDLDNRLLRTVCFYAEGVKLACTGSPVLEELQSLVAKDVIVCTTCLNHYGLLDELQVGHAGGMKDIVEAQWTASKVITC